MQINEKNYPAACGRPHWRCGDVGRRKGRTEFLESVKSHSRNGLLCPSCRAPRGQKENRRRRRGNVGKAWQIRTPGKEVGTVT